MGTLSFTMIASVDGYVVGPDGTFDWAEPGAEAHFFINEKFRDVGTSVMGRHMYEVMRIWETWGTEPGAAPQEAEFGELWRGIDKVVYSTTLTEVETPRTRLEPTFDAAALRALADSMDHTISIDGPTLAAHALRAGIVDEIGIYTVPVIVGGGLAMLPSDVRLDLELQETVTFDDGWVFTRYAVRR